MRGAAAGETQEVAQEQGAPQQEAAPPPANAPQGQATLPCVPSQAQNLPISAPPRVVYRDRLLSIDAPGSTLADVLRVIHNKAGIAFEGTTKTTERVAVKISPAPISDALKQLFKDSPFDYMMIARPEGNTVRVWRTSPVVKYRDNLLSVEASNSTLSSVLEAIHEATGIEFQGADGADEPVAVKLGPAPVDNVMADLLHGSQFNYIVLGAGTTPAKVEQVVLSSRSECSPNGAPPVQTPLVAGQQRQSAADDESEEPDGRVPQTQAAESPLQRVVQGEPLDGVQIPQEVMDRLRALREKQQELMNNPQLQNNPAAPRKPQ